MVLPVGDLVLLIVLLLDQMACIVGPSTRSSCIGAVRMSKLFSLMGASLMQARPKRTQLVMEKCELSFV